MAKIDQITEEAKKTIIDLLNKSIGVEYTMVMNYPRILDYISHIGKPQSKEFMKHAERLGKESFRHATIVAKLITDLGGEPVFDILTIDGMMDVHSMLVKQLDKERIAESIYKEARLIAVNNQAEEKGLFNKLMSIGEEPPKFTSRSEIIKRLTALAAEEMGHAKRCELLMLEENSESKKNDS